MCLVVADGNAEVDNKDHGAGTMEAIYWGNCTGWGAGDESGPWVMADLENGLWGGDQKVNPINTPIHAKFVTAMVKGEPGGFVLKGGDAQTGPLKTLYAGPRPSGYNPMNKQVYIATSSHTTEPSIVTNSSTLGQLEILCFVDSLPALWNSWATHVPLRITSGRALSLCLSVITDLTVFTSDHLRIARSCSTIAIVSNRSPPKYAWHASR